MDGMILLSALCIRNENCQPFTKNMDKNCIRVSGVPPLPFPPELPPEGIGRGETDRIKHGHRLLPGLPVNSGSNDSVHFDIPVSHGGLSL